jgi:hypothetical protein
MKIIIDQPIETLSREDQDAIFKLSRNNRVFCRDVNGDLWQVLDLTVANPTVANQDAFIFQGNGEPPIKTTYDYEE